MAHEMRSDAELLNTLCDEAPVYNNKDGTVTVLSKKLIAHWTGLSIQTVSDYATGRLNIPIAFWRAIVVHLADQRIINLLLPGDVYMVEVARLADDSPTPTGIAWFREAIEAEGLHHQQQAYLADILADGRVGETDDRAVRDYDDAYYAHRRRDAQLHRQIIDRYQRTKDRKVRRP